jgi:GNAT superfamily N-acetyltransferase
MDVILRRGRPEDADACGVIVYEAFKSIASQHNFPLDIPSAEIGIGLVKRMLSHPGFHSLIAEKYGNIVGSLFLDERGSITAVSPLTIDPASQNQSVGRLLMLTALERAAERRFTGVRLVQSAYHYRALCLYAKLGFRAREPLSKMSGAPLGLSYLAY